MAKLTRMVIDPDKFHGALIDLTAVRRGPFITITKFAELAGISKNSSAVRAYRGNTGGSLATAMLIVRNLKRLGLPNFEIEDLLTELPPE